MDLLEHIVATDHSFYYTFSTDPPYDSQNRHNEQHIHAQYIQHICHTLNLYKQILNQNLDVSVECLLVLKEKFVQHLNNWTIICEYAQNAYIYSL